nr:helix-turn-helix domain-containing protein [Pedobacter paludis]
MRKTQGHKVRPFAMLADIEHHQLINIEKGRVDLRVSTLIKICNALDILPKQLLAAAFDNGSVFPDPEVDK